MSELIFTQQKQQFLVQKEFKVLLGNLLNNENLCLSTKFNEKSSNVINDRNITNKHSKVVFWRIKKRLANLRRFYPELYNKNESILTMWGRCDKSELIDMKILNCEEKIRFLWI